MGQKRPISIEKRPFLVYSTRPEIRCKFDHFGPKKGRWARNGPFPFTNGLFFWSTAQEQKFDANLTISGPKRADGPETARFY